MDPNLRKNVRDITTRLGQIIRENEGDDFYRVVEQVRILCKDLRDSKSIGKTGKLKKIMMGLSVPDAHHLARAFTMYFQLVNLVEENFRVKKVIESEKDSNKPAHMSVGRVLKELHAKKVPASKIKESLEQISIEPVLTAHPTEAKRKTVIKHLSRIQSIMENLDNPNLTWREKEKYEEAILERMEMLWQTKQVRDRKLRVEDEIKFILNFFPQTIFSAVREFQLSFKKGLRTNYPGLKLEKPILRFGSWVGGDRDGNPLVLPETSRHALKHHREIIITYYKNSLNKLFGLLTSAKRFEKVDKDLEESVASEMRVFPILRRKFKHAEPGEYYRMKLHSIWKRLDNTQSGHGPRYSDISEFQQDLRLIQKSLKSHHGHRTSQGSIQKVIDETKVYGFYLARLDFRQHAQKIRTAIQELLGRWPDPDEWPSLIANPPLKFRVVSKQTRQIMNEFKTQRLLQDEFGKRATDHVVLSMTQNESDLWAFLFLARKCGLLNKINKNQWDLRVHVVPLFETVVDLKNAKKIMHTLWTNSFYRSLLRSRKNLQEVMLGYSDSNKSGGYFSANFELYKVQHGLADEAKRCHVKLRFFHGKGGSIDRGGGPAHRAVLAAPDSATGYKLRITEQGEVIYHKYGHSVIAQRNFEQMTSAVMTAGLLLSGKVLTTKDRELFEEVLDDLSDFSMHHYRELVYNTPEFQTYFSQSSPIDLIQRIQIASRPVFRKGAGDFKELRAIPWVFSWTQNRHLLSAWYGIGTGIHMFVKKRGRQGEKMLRRMYRQWPFFSSLIDNAQVSLAKTDLMIAERYASLVEDERIRRVIFGKIEEEYRLTKKYILQISSQRKLLQNSPVLYESIDLRNPYIDPLNALQVEYLKLWRSGKLPRQKRDEVLLVLLLTVNGIAFGMKSTG